jgi:hypothetical protein
MTQTLEQRLKMLIGELQFVNAELSRQLEEAQEKIKELTLVETPKFAVVDN